MEPKAKRRKAGEGEVVPPAPSDPYGMFRGIVAFLVPEGVQLRRLQIWKQKLLQMGGMVENNFSERVTHVLALDSEKALEKLGPEQLEGFNGEIIQYDWLEACLKSGKRLSTELYILDIKSELTHNRLTERSSLNDLKVSHPSSEIEQMNHHTDSSEILSRGESQSSPVHTDSNSDGESPRKIVSDASMEEPSLLYSPPDLNRNICEIFGKLINIYKALGDDRRSFSYYKAIPVIEKLPSKIESVDQVKHLPAIGKSMQDHIHEIVTTGKLSKLEHFENDVKVRTVSLFGEVWGIGPTTALKLYEKGYRSLQDLEKEDSLTNAQRLGLKYFDDIKERIPRHEVQEMESLLKRAGEAVLHGVVVVCGGSYRRGKFSCGDMDIVITHPDGKSHKGFLPKLVQYLKDINFLREDLVYSIHSIEGTDSGVDTYFGLCTYPGREKRHRIDVKVYPQDIYAFGLIAWTGNDVLNRRLRLLAESKGYRLDDTGLFLATQSSGHKRGMKSSTSVSCRTEKEVFDLLGFPWLEPHERNL